MEVSLVCSSGISFSPAYPLFLKFERGTGSHFSSSFQALRDTVDSPYHQYTRPAGHPPLVKLLASRYSLHLDRQVDPFDEVAVTVGASQALYLALQLYCHAGDEVVLFEPFFDLYLKQIKLTGASPKYVPMGGKAATLADPWAIDMELLERFHFSSLLSYPLFVPIAIVLYV